MPYWILYTSKGIEYLRGTQTEVEAYIGKTQDYKLEEIGIKDLYVAKKDPDVDECFQHIESILKSQVQALDKLEKDVKFLLK